MAKIQLAVMCVTLWALPPIRALNCLRRCCSTTEIDHAGHQLTSSVVAPNYMPSSQGCKASSKGHLSERSISPWRYEKDENSSRYPFRLWQAHCNCPMCIALTAGENRSEMSPHGNTAVVSYTTIVFFRKPCATEPHRFILVPELYTVNVSCTCVVPQKAS